MAQFLTPIPTKGKNKPLLLLLTCMAVYIRYQKYRCSQYFCCYQKIGLAAGEKGVFHTSSSLGTSELQYDDKLPLPFRYIQISDLHWLISCVETRLLTVCTVSKEDMKYYLRKSILYILHTYFGFCYKQNRYGTTSYVCSRLKGCTLLFKNDTAQCFWNQSILERFLSLCN